MKFEDREILKFFERSADQNGCKNAVDVYMYKGSSLKLSINEIHKRCLVLQKKDFLRLINFNSNNPESNCYHITFKGMEKLHPPIRDRLIIILQITGTCAAIIAAISGLILLVNV